MTVPVDYGRLQAYALGDSAEGEREAIRELVRSDPAWRAALDEVLEVQLAMYEVAEEVAAEAQVVVPQRAPSRPRWLQWMVPLLLAAGVGLWLLPQGATSAHYMPELRVVASAAGGTCGGPSGGVVLGPEVPRSAPLVVCKGERLELSLRPDTATRWSAPQVTLDGVAVPCRDAPVGDSGAGVVTCEVGIQLVVPPTGRHALVVRMPDGATHAFEVESGEGK